MTSCTELGARRLHWYPRPDVCQSYLNGAATSAFDTRAPDAVLALSTSLRDIMKLCWRIPLSMLLAPEPILHKRWDSDKPYM